MADDIQTTDECARAATEIENAVYEATGLLEDLEHEGRVRGNGHHMRQELAAYASRLLRARWVDDDITEKGGKP